MDQKKLAKKLRKLAADIAAEPIPPRFAELLGDDDPPPFGGASGARPQPVEKLRPLRSSKS